MAPPLRLVLVVPCFNEAARLDGPAFIAFRASHPEAHLIFVNDGSDDATPEMLEALKAQAGSGVDVLHLPSRQGKGGAVRAGILAGLNRRPDLVGFWDADLATPLDAVDDFLALAAKRPDLEILLGSRVALMGRDIRRTPWRHYLGRAFATAVSLALELPVYDTQCGAKMFRAGDAIGRAFADPFRSRWIFDVEVIARYLRLPAQPGEPPRRSRIYELAVSRWHHVPGSKLRATDYFRALFELAAIHRDLRE